MIQINSIVTALVLLVVVLVANINCNEIQNEQQRKLETFALTRDGFYRENPDELLFGFFAAWPVVLYIIGVTFLAIAIIAFLGYVTGICKGRNNRYVSAINY